MINIKPKEIELVKQWLMVTDSTVCNEIRIKMKYLNIITFNSSFKFTEKGKAILKYLRENEINYYTSGGVIDNTFYPRFLD
jgi:predicted transcriptional regulator